MLSRLLYYFIEVKNHNECNFKDHPNIRGSCLTKHFHVMSLATIWLSLPNFSMSMKQYTINVTMACAESPAGDSAGTEEPMLFN
jgi:hypothetical protein